MEKATALSILQTRVLIPSVGKFTVKATSVNPIIRENGTQVTIVNFNAMTAYGADLAKKAFKAGDYEASVGKGTSLSASQLNGMFVPSKGEIVDIEVSEHVNKEGVTILVVSSIVPRKAIVAKAFSFDLDEEGEPEVVAEAEEAIA